MHRWNCCAPLFAVIVLALAAANAQARAYKCVDAEGRIEYRELPAAEAECTELRPPPPPPTVAAAEPSAVNTPGEPSNPRYREACQTARNNLESLQRAQQAGQPVARTNESGELERIEGEALEAFRRATQEEVEFFCR